MYQSSFLNEYVAELDLPWIGHGEFCGRRFKTCQVWIILYINLQVISFTRWTVWIRRHTQERERVSLKWTEDKLDARGGVCVYVGVSGGVTIYPTIGLSNFIVAAVTDRLVVTVHWGRSVSGMFYVYSMLFGLYFLAWYDWHWTWMFFFKVFWSFFFCQGNAGIVSWIASDRQSKKKRRQEINILVVVLTYYACIYADGTHLLLNTINSVLRQLFSCFYSPVC